MFNLNVFSDNSNIILFSLLLIFFGVLLLQLSRTAHWIQYLVVTIVPGLFLYEHSKYYFFSNHQKLEFSLLKLFGFFEIKFLYTEISSLFLVMVGSLWWMNSIYSIGYLKIKKIKFTNFSTLIFISIACTAFLASSGNLFTLFLFYELLTFTTYFLVSFDDIVEAKTAGSKYFTILFLTSSCFFLVVMAGVYGLFNTTNFTNNGLLSLYSAARELWILLAIVLVFVLYGCSKAATVPFHTWLPQAMIAHTPVSALLHAVAVVKSGIVSMLYIIIYIFGLDNLYKLQQIHTIAFQIPKYLAGFSAIYASSIAMRKKEFKRVLAYSTIGQLGYLVMLVFSFHQEMPKILMFQLIAHAFAKINMFFIAGFLYLKYKIKKIDELYGLWNYEQIIVICFGISVLSIIGIPPTVGMMSKFNVMFYAITNKEFFILGIILFGTILNCYYFLPIIVDMIFGVKKNFEIKEVTIEKEIKKYYIVLYIPIIVVATLIFSLFFASYFLLK